MKGKDITNNGTTNPFNKFHAIPLSGAQHGGNIRVRGKTSSAQRTISSTATKTNVARKQNKSKSLEDATTHTRTGSESTNAGIQGTRRSTL